MDKQSKANNTNRIFKVREILFKKTDENNSITLYEIIEELKEYYGNNFNVSLKSLTNDIKILKTCGVDIRSCTVEHGKKIYRNEEKLFETNELRVLIDSLSASRSIGANDKERIITKVKGLTSENIARELSNQIYIDNKIVNKDKTFRYSVDKIHISIQNRKKIEFKYGRYDINKNFLVNNKIYMAHPYDLVWDNGFYYLVAYDDTKEKIINFRIDRMRQVEILNENYAKVFTFDLDEHLKTCFNMYPGKKNLIRIQFDNHLINAIIDKFGIDIQIDKTDEHHFTLTTTAAINTGLIRWILNWGSDAKIISPQKLIDEVKEELEKMNQIYNL